LRRISPLFNPSKNGILYKIDEDGNSPVSSLSDNTSIFGIS